MKIYPLTFSSTLYRYMQTAIIRNIIWTIWFSIFFDKIKSKLLRRCMYIFNMRTSIQIWICVHAHRDLLFKNESNICFSMWARMYPGWLRRCSKDSYLDNAWEIQLVIMHVEGPLPKLPRIFSFNVRIRKIWISKVSTFSTEGEHIWEDLLSWVHLIDQRYFHYSIAPLHGKILGDVLGIG